MSSWGDFLDINALFSRETRLETLVDGWYLDKENKVIYDFKCGRYPYSKIEKLAKGCRVINDDWAGFIFPNTPGVFKIKEEKGVMQLLKITVCM